ncbi:reverse transcriptase domain-containing protein [Tanacetum coccineum]
MRSLSNSLPGTKKTKARNDIYNVSVAFLTMGNRHRMTTTNSTRRCKVPSSGHRLLHKMGRSKAANINNREAHGKVRVGIHSVQVEVTNREVIKGMEHRLGKTHQGWVDELPQVLWAHRTTPKSSNRETPFNIVYGSEAVIPIEISVETRRIQDFDPKQKMIKDAGKIWIFLKKEER